jgi:hypothetical protein
MHLERWMIDEILEGDVRVLRATLRGNAPEADAVSGYLERDTRDHEDARDPVRELVIGVEAASVDVWTPEIETYVDYPRLEAFILGRATTASPAGLPVRDHLREGDVYWVLTAGEPHESTRHYAAEPTAVQETPNVLDAWSEEPYEVWDVTAAARQVIKRLYGRAATAEPDERGTASAGADG